MVKCNNHTKKSRKGGNWFGASNNQPPFTNPLSTSNNPSPPISNPVSSNTLTQGTNWFTSAYDAVKNSVKKVIPSSTPTYSTPTYSTPTYSNYGSQGGKKRKGGYYASRSLTNVASTASPIRIPTAKPQVWVGGKKWKCTKRHKHKKSCKMRKTKRHM